MPPPPQTADGLDLGALVGALRRGWPLTLLAVVVATAAAAWFAHRQPSIYQASSVVYIETKETDPGPVGSALGIVGGRTIANEIQMLQLSEALQEAVAARFLGVPDTAAGRTPPEVARLARALASTVGFAPLESGTDMIQISARGRDPAQVAQLANTYAEVYSERGRALSQAGVRSSRALLERQAARQQRELEAAEANLAGFLSGAGTVDIGQEGQNAVSQVAQLDAATEEARVELEVARARRAQLAGELSRVKAGLPGRVSSSAQNEITALQQRVAQLEVSAGEFYARDPSLRGNEARAPELARLVRQIEAARARLDELAGQYVDESMAAGGIDGSGGLGYVTQLQRQVAEADVEIRGLQQRMAVLRQRQGRYEGELRRLPAQEVRLAQLERERQAAEQTFVALDARARELGVAEGGDLGFVQVVREADVPTYPVAPNRPQTIVLGAVLGLLLGLGLTLLRHAGDSRVRTTEEIRTQGLRVIGTVPDFTSALKKAYGRQDQVETSGGAVAPLVASGADPFSLVTEAFRYLRATVGFARPGRPPHVLLVTSPGPGEGKSTVAMGLALSFARAGRRTLYVEADLRKPSAHRFIPDTGGRGLTERLTDGGPLDWDALQRPLPATAGGAAGGVLHVLAAGGAVDTPTELLDSDRMQILLDEARAAFDVIVVDSSPVLPVPDALHVATGCDAALVVAEAGKTEQAAIAHTHAALVATGTDVLGVVLNRASDRGLAGYGYGYGGAARGDGAAPPAQLLTEPPPTPPAEVRS